MSEFQNIYIVIRLYFEKPRTIKGWKGFLYDPTLDNTNKIDIINSNKKIINKITKLQFYSYEFLDTIIPNILMI